MMVGFMTIAPGLLKWIFPIQGNIRMDMGAARLHVYPGFARI
jgi:hypothetical protein